MKNPEVAPTSPHALDVEAQPRHHHERLGPRGVLVEAELGRVVEGLRHPFSLVALLRRAVPLVERLGLAKLGKLAKFSKFLAGSFSAVSKRNFARKYAFDSIFQALQDLHTFAPLQSQNFRKKSV